MIAALAALILGALQPAQGPAPPCTRASAVQASVTDIGRNPGRYLDQCVRVTGLFSGVRMYSGRDGIYLTSRFGADGNYLPANLVHRIGIDNQQMRSLRLRGLVRAEVIGRVDSCGRRSQRIIDAGGIPFLGGYCHYERGPSVVVNEYRLLRGRAERLIGERARHDFGNIVQAPLGWRHRAGLEAVAGNFLAALRARDRQRMAQLHEIPAGTDNEYHRRMLRMLAEDEASPFADVRRQASPQMAIFLTSRQGVPLEQQASARAAGIICFCRGPDCSDRWPISGVDVDNAPERPYACTRVEPRGTGARGAILSTSSAEQAFLAEPARTAIRR